MSSGKDMVGAGAWGTAALACQIPSVIPKVDTLRTRLGREEEGLSNAMGRTMS